MVQGSWFRIGKTGSGLQKSANQNVQLVSLVGTKMLNWFDWFYLLKVLGPLVSFRSLGALRASTNFG